MAKAGRTLARVAVAGILLLTARPSGAEDMTIVAVNLTNRADIATDDLLAAQEQVRKVYETVGVRIIWMADESETAPGRGLFRVHVVLLARKEADQMAQTSEHDVLGLSVAPARLAYVFSRRVLIATLTRGTSFVDGLGKVIAHELGHLLLPGQGHTAAGLMCASVLCPAQGRSFSEQHGASIRELLHAALNWSDAELARELWARVRTGR